MDAAALATMLVSMNAASTRHAAGVAVLKQRLDMQKSVLDLLAPASPPPASPGMGRLVDKTA